MEMIKDFFEKIYNNGSTSFYLIVGGVCLILIAIILFILAFSKRKENKEEIKEEKNDNVLDVNNIDENKDLVAHSEENVLSETKVLNSLLMGEDNTSFESNEMEKADLLKEDSVYIEKTDMTDYNIPLIHEDKDDIVSSALPDVNIDVVDETNNEEVDINEKPLIDDKAIVPFDIDADFSDLLSGREEANNSVINDNSEEAIIVENDNRETDTVTISNEEIMKKLESLQKSKTENIKKEIEKPSIDEELESIIKTVGLEDTMIIPNIESEESILGK